MKILKRSFLKFFTLCKVFGTATLLFLVHPSFGDELAGYAFSSSNPGISFSGISKAERSADVAVNGTADLFLNPASAPAPDDVTVCAGGNATFSVLTTGTYEWQINTGSGWNKIPGETQQTLNLTNVTNSMNGYQYQCLVNGTPNGPATLTVRPFPVAAGTITGSSSVCQGQGSVSYTVPVITNATSYQWSYTGLGATISNGTTNSILVTFASNASSGNLTVWGVNSCGNGTVSANYLITVNPLPAPAGTISGTSSVCEGANGVSYSVPTITNATSYTWAYSGTGATIHGNSNTITIDFGVGATSGNLTVTGTNTCGNGTNSAIYSIIVNPGPGAAGVISGSNTVCQGRTGVNYTVPDIDDATSYSWTFPSGATIISGGGTSSVSVNFSSSATPGNITVKGNNTCGSGSISSNFSLTVDPLPGAAGAITGSSSVCQGQTGVSYSVLQIANATGYNWVLPAGAFITSGSNTNSITVSFAATTVNGNITVQGTNGCGSGVISNNFPVSVAALPSAAGTISGPITVCQGQTSVVYTVPGIGGATGYTWSVPSNATIVAGNNTNSITVDYSNTAVSGNVTVFGTNSCGNGGSSNLGITVNPLPDPAGTIVGPSSVCQGQTGVVFSVAAINHVTGYNWTLPAGASIVTGAGTNSISVNFNASATSGDIRVQGTNACGSGSISNNFSLTVNPLPGAAGAIVGSSSVCQGQTGVSYSIPPINNVTGYNWVLPAGATIASGSNTNSITVDFALTTVSGNITVQGINGCGNGLVSNSYPVLVAIMPSAAGLISGSATVCQGQTSVVYSVSTIGAATGYTWSVPSNATIVAGNNTNSITVNYGNTALSGNVTVFGTNSCGNGTASNLGVTVNPLPDPAGDIVGPSSVCQGQTGVVYSVPAIANATGYNWTLPAGASIASGAGNNSISVNFNASAISGNITVQGTNGCGNGLVSKNFAVTVNNTTGAAGAITGNSTVCQGLTGVAYSVLLVANAASYNWTLPVGASIASGFGTSSITVDFSTSSSTGSLTVQGTNGCGNGVVSPNFPVTVNPLPDAAGTITSTTGGGVVCQGQTGVTYSIPDVPHATGYNWTLPAGAVIAAGNNTRSISVNYSNGATTGNVTVTPFNSCGNGVVSAPFPVTVNPLPADAGGISGSNNVCQSQNNVAYTVGVIANAVTYHWAYSGIGATITGTTNNITINFASNATSGDLTVYASNSCGNGVVSATFPVTVNVGAPLQPGPITGSSTVCQGAFNVPYSISPVASAVSYIWSLPVGATIVGPANGSSIVVNFANNAASGNITVSGVNGCGTGIVPAVLSVVVNPLPAAAGAISGTPTVCQGNAGTTYSVAPIANAVSYNWTLPAGAGIVSGANSNSIIVNFSNTALSGDIIVNGTNGCGNGISSPAYPVSVTPLPVAAGVISGKTSVCPGETGVIYSVPFITNATSYSWSLPSGASFSGPNNTQTITVDFSSLAASGNISVVGINSCGNGVASSDYAVSVGTQPGAAGSVSGSSVVCQGQSAVIYSVTPIPNATDYIWSLPSGASIVSGANSPTISVNYANNAVNGSITVYGQNSCGNGAISASFPVTVNPLPGAPGLITGATVVCQGQTGVPYDVPIIANADGYNWVLPIGATIISGGNTNRIVVNFSTTALGGNISVQGTNGCGNGIFSANYPVTVNALPDAAGTVFGPPTVCQGQTGVAFTTSLIGHATGYVWNLPSGATISSGANSPAITVDFSASATSGDISVYGTTTCGSGLPSPNYPVTVQANPGAAGAITGSSTVCQGQTSVAYTVPAIPNATGYVWTLPAGAAITSGDNTNSILVSYSATASSGNVIVYGTNACSNGSSSSLSVNVNPLPGVSGPVLGGPSTVCEGATGIIYSVAPISNATGYVWSLPSGAVITSGSNTSTITVSFISGASSGNISVYGTNGCGNGVASPNFSLTVNQLPSAPGTISGPATVCQGQSGVTYTLPSVGHATGYIWSLPSGATISSGANTSTITVSFSTTAISGAITVQGTNGCGNGPVSANFPVDVQLLPSAAGVISGSSLVCQGQNGVVYTVPSISGATRYDWTVPPGVTITLGQGTTSITVNFSVTASAGNIQVIGHNDCGDGLSSSLPVSVNPLPSAAGSITGITAVCDGATGVTYSVPSITNATGYIWSLPAGAVITAGDNSSTITVSFLTGTTSGNISVYGTNGCGNGASSPNFAVQVNKFPLTPGAITGSASVCQNQIGVNYAVPAIGNATGYVWTLPSGATISSGANTPSIVVNFSSTATSGNLSVYGTSACGNSPSSILPISVALIPGAAGAISGPAVLCQGTSGLVYSVPAIANAQGYVWSLPAGAAIVAGDNTNTITVNYATNASSGNVSVYGTNSCGNGVTSPSYPVTVDMLPANAGTIIGPSSVCQGSSNNIFTVPAISHAVNYIWTLPSGATISSGGNTNTIKVSFSNTATSGVITVTGINGCGNGATSANFDVSVNPLPDAAGTVSGSGIVCKGSNGVVYSVAAITNATGYSWSYPAGSSIAAGANTNSIVLNYSNGALSGNVTVQGTNACGSGTVSPNLPVTVQSLPAPAGVVTGTSVLCQGTANVIYSVPAIAGATDYVWSLPNGATISGSVSNTITVNFSSVATSGVVKVYGINSCGNGLSSPDFGVTVNPKPDAAGAILGIPAVCQNQSGVVYSVPSIANATGYVWSLPAGASITSGGNSATITVSFSSSATSGTVSVYGINGCGVGSVSASFPVSVQRLPAAAGSITGTSLVCQGQNGVVYSVPSIVAATQYNWTVPAGVTITSGQGTTSITVNFATDAAAGTIQVSGRNTCGDGPSSSLPFNVNPLPDAAGIITGPSAVCEGATGVVYNVASIANVTGYVWSLPSGALLISGANTSSITVSFPAGTTSGNISVYGTNGCGNGVVSPNLSVTISQLPLAPGTISGASGVCQSQSGVTYSIPAIGNATGYIWTLPSGASITAGANSASITVAFSSGALSGNITVQGTNICGNGPVSASFPVTVQQLPLAAGVITGSSLVCQGEAGVVYTVPSIVGATQYNWTVPAGAIITSGQGTTSIVVNFANNALPGNIQVSGRNTCGDGPSSSLAFSVNPLPDAAGLITGLATVCEGVTGVNYSVASIANATGYVWSLPSGAIITSGMNTASITVSFPAGTASGNISVYGTNGCGNGVSSPGLLVTVNQLPLAPGTISGASGVCQSQSGVTYSVPALANATGYLWTLPSGASITAGANSASITVSYSAVALSGNIIVQGTNTCGNGPVSASFPVNVQQLPLAAGVITGSSLVCQGQTGVIYTVPSIIGANLYNWTVPAGATITSGQGTTSITVNFAANASAGNIQVSGRNTCGDGPSSSLAFSVNPLPGTAGTITGLANFCEGATGVTYSVASIANATGYVWSLPPGAVITSGANTSSITASFPVGTSSGNISVYGTNSCGSGVVSPKLAVTYNKLPLAPGTISGASGVCQSQSGVTYSVPAIGNATGYIWTLPSGASITAGANSASITVSYSAVALSGNVTVQGTNICGNGPVSASFPVIVQQLPLAAGVITGSSLVCQGQTGVTYTVPSIIGATQYNWTVPVGATITSGQGTTSITVNFTTSATAGSIQVSGRNTCGDGPSSSLAFSVNPLPDAAGLITGLSAVCDGATGVVYSVAPITNATGYVWSLPSGAVITSGANTSSITASFPVGASSGNISVYGTNSCGSGVVSPNLALTYNKLPLAPGTISGASGVCQTQTGVAYSVPAISNATGYIWTLPSGASITSGANSASITVSYSAVALSGNITVQGTSSCGNGPVSASFPVTVQQLPLAAGVIAGSSLVCQGQNGVIYSVPAIVGATQYDWVVPAGVTITSGQGSTSITVNFSNTALGGNIQVSGSNNCGSGPSSSFNVAVTPSASVNAGVDAVICSTGDFTVSSASALNYGALLWSSDGSGTFSNNGTLTPTYTPSAVDILNGSVVITLTADNITPCLGSVKDDMKLTIQSAPTANAGSDNSVCYPNSFLLSGKATNYTNPHWIHNGNGVLMSANTLNPTYHPDVADVGNTVTLTLIVDGQNPCAMTATDQMQLQVNAFPANPGVINGTTPVCKGVTATYFVVTIPNATGYVWSVPLGATIVSGNNTSNIQVKFGATAVSGNISVYGTNGCGNGVVSTLPVVVNDIPLNPGTISGNAQVCQGSTGMIYSVSPVAGATSYVWTVPAGAVITSALPYTNSITVDFGPSATSGNVTVYASNACGDGSVSTKAVRLNPKPATPTISAIGGPTTFCEGGSVTLTGPTAGYNYLWTPGGATTQNNTVTVSGSYSVVITDVLTGCSSNASNSVSVTVLPAPNAPTSIGFIKDCWNNVPPTKSLDANSVTTVQPGTTLVWFDAATGGNVVALPTLVGYGSVTYYAEAQDNVTNCTSLTRTPVTLTIVSTPATPVKGTDVSNDSRICETSPITTLTATTLIAPPAGTVINWFTAPTGGLPVSPTLSSVGTKTFYAEASNGICSSSARSAGVVLTIDPAPQPPVSGGDLIQCEMLPAIQTLTATASLPAGLPAGSTVTWFDQPVGGNIVLTPTLSSLGTITYYAETKNSSTNCVSLTRTPVKLTIISHPAPPVAGADITECEKSPIQTLTATATVPIGSTIKWYDQAVNGIQIAPTLKGVGTKTVYAETDNGICTSLTRTPVVLKILPAPAVPVSTGNIVQCETKPTIQILDAQDAIIPVAGMVIDWYDKSSLGNKVAVHTLSSVGTVTYYAEARNSVTNCSSLARTAVTLTISPTPETPVFLNDISECVKSPVQTLDANNGIQKVAGVTYTWYDLPTLGSVTSPTINYVGTKTVYAEASIGGCVNPTRKAVKLSIDAAPPAPVSLGNKTECSSSGNLPLVAAASAPGYTIDWYTTPTGGFKVAPAPPTLNEVGTVTYYAEARDPLTGCTSLTRSAAIVLTVNKMPEPPVTDPDITVCATNPVQKLTATATVPSGVTLLWYTSAVGGSVVADPSINAVGTKSYFAASKIGTCENATRKEVKLTINPAPATPITKAILPMCEPQSVNLTTAAVVSVPGATISFYTTPTGGSPVSNIWNEVGTATFYAEARMDNTGCVSLVRSAPIVVTINPTPQTPVKISDLTECVTNPVQILDANNAISKDTGVTYTWYNAATGNTVVSSPTLNKVGGPVTYWVEATLNSCKSAARTSVALTINNAPAAPVLNTKYKGKITECENIGGIQTLDANNALASPGPAIKWYDTPTGGFEVIPQLSSIGTVTYYAAATNANDCESTSRTPVILTINPLPLPPVSSGDITECVNAPVQTLNANSAITIQEGTKIKWYQADNLTPVSNLPTLKAVGTVTYYVESIDLITGCVSATRTPVVLTLNAHPATPVYVGSGTLSECETSPIVPLDANLEIAKVPGDTISWFTAATAGFPVASPVLNSVGSVTYYAEAVQNSCSSLIRKPVKLIINAAPAKPVSLGDIRECAKFPVTQVLDANSAISGLASGDSIVWYDAVTGGAIVASPTLSVAGDSITYYAESKNLATGCTSLERTAVKLTIGAPPPASAASNSPLSLGETLLLKGGPDLENLTYTWTTPGGSTLSGMDISIPAITENGAGVYRLTVTDKNGCSSYDSTIVVIASATADYAKPVCLGSTLYLSAGPDNMASYSWTGPDGFSSNLQNPSINNVTIYKTGDYVVTVIDKNGFTSTAKVYVSFKSLPLAMADAAPVCPGATLNLLAGPNNMSSYSWTGPNGFVSNLKNPSIPNYRPSAPESYILTVIDLNGCEATDTVTTNIFTPVATSNSPICQGDTLRLRAEPNGMTSYSWSGPNGFTSSRQNPSLPGAGLAATGQYTLTVKDKTGCTSTATVDVTFNAPPAVPSITSSLSNPVCEGASLTLSGPSGMNAYLWTGPNKFTSVGQDALIPVVTKSLAGTYTLKVTNANGCSSSANYGLTVITASFNGTYGPFCATDGAVTLSATPAGGTFSGQGVTGNRFDPATAGVGSHTISYTAPNGSCPVAPIIISVVSSTPTLVTNSTSLLSCNGTADLTLPEITAGSLPGLVFTYWTDSAATKPLVNPKAVGVGTYYIKGATASGKCFDIKPVTVNPSDALQAKFVSVSPTCSGSATGSISVVVTKGASPFTYRWDTNPVKTTNKIDSLKAGIYTVTVTDANSCSITLKDTLRDHPGVKILFAKKDIQCLSDANGTARVDSVTISGAPSPLNLYSFAWNTTPVQNTREAVRLSYGYHTVTLTDSKGCGIKDSILINSLDTIPPTIDCRKDTITIIVQSIDPASASPNNIVVDLGKPVVWDNCGVATLTNDAPEKYRIGITRVVWTVTDFMGLTDTCSQVVYVKAIPTVPKLFTPNGDGINDYFVIDGLQDFPKSKLYVYTRSGQLVYSSEDYKDPWWDGRFQTSKWSHDQKVATGVYYYVLNLGTINRKIQGFVYISY